MLDAKSSRLGCWRHLKGRLLVVVHALDGILLLRIVVKTRFRSRLVTESEFDFPSFALHCSFIYSLFALLCATSWVPLESLASPAPVDINHLHELGEDLLVQYTYDGRTFRIKSDFGDSQTSDIVKEDLNQRVFKQTM